MRKLNAKTKLFIPTIITLFISIFFFLLMLAPISEIDTHDGQRPSTSYNMYETITVMNFQVENIDYYRDGPRYIRRFDYLKLQEEDLRRELMELYRRYTTEDPQYKAVNFALQDTQHLINTFNVSVTFIVFNTFLCFFSLLSLVLIVIDDDKIRYVNYFKYSSYFVLILILLVGLSAVGIEGTYSTDYLKYATSITSPNTFNSISFTILFVFSFLATGGLIAFEEIFGDKKIIFKKLGFASEKAQDKDTVNTNQDIPVVMPVEVPKDNIVKPTPVKAPMPQPVKAPVQQEVQVKAPTPQKANEVVKPAPTVKPVPRRAPVPKPAPIVKPHVVEKVKEEEIPVIEILEDEVPIEAAKSPVDTINEVNIQPAKVEDTPVEDTIVKEDIVEPVEEVVSPTPAIEEPVIEAQVVEEPVVDEPVIETSVDEIVEDQEVESDDEVEETEEEEIIEDEVAEEVANETMEDEDDEELDLEALLRFEPQMAIDEEQDDEEDVVEDVEIKPIKIK